jgi:hypothetical protein
MGRPPKWLAEENSLMGLLPLREFWRAINRSEREAQANERAKRKAHDKCRAKCRCEAYPWPHRPGGGLCRYPDPPLERYQRKAGGRPFGKRYAGLRRQIARNNGLHPIRDRAKIDALMPQALDGAKELHRQHPKVKYRNMKITDKGVTGYWTPAGPTM